MSILNNFLRFKKEYILDHATEIRNVTSLLYLCNTFPSQIKELKD